MRFSFLQFLSLSAVVGIFLLVPPQLVFPQSQAQNGQIEGTVVDQNNAALRLVVVTVTNIETGASRSVITSEAGVYRFPLLPLGKYRIDAEVVNFKSFARAGILLSAGQTATIDIQLQTGTVEETVTVSADSSIADAGKTDLSRVMNTREVQNLPLVARNPLNFALLQAYASGRQGRGFAGPHINVNGYLRRVNFRLDGNANTAHRARFMIISETFVNEVQLVTNGFAAEFGDTPGMIMNVVTPAGTNAVHGSSSYSFRRPSFYSRPFFYPASANFPDNKASIVTAALGAPIVKDRWQFYFGYEWHHRDDKAVAARLVTITPANQAALIATGLPASIFTPAIPSLERGAFYIFRTDVQLNDNNRLMARFNSGDTSSDNLIAGGFNTLERSIDAFAEHRATAVQLASYSTVFFNEFRFQYGQRVGGYRRNKFSGTGPSITIPVVANFGSPVNGDTVFPPLRITQFQDNLTRTAATHVVKFGGGFSNHDYTERQLIFSQYRFPSVDAYVAARNGGNLLGYNQYTETFGNPETNYKATYWNFFVQDDWKITRRLKVNFGLRYDLYQLPKTDPSLVFPLLQKFDVDKNNFAPRLGVAYALREGRRPTVIRFGAGIYYEAPLLGIFRDVIRFNGSSSFSSFTVGPTADGAPEFPNTLGSLPPGAVFPRQDIYTIAQDYDTMYAVHSNIQLEQPITEDLSVALGYVYSAGRHINVYRNINPINPVRYLADGRPVFGDKRFDPRFNTIVIAESSGNARYDAFVLQLNQRLKRGIQFSANYTLSRGINDTPDGDLERIVQSDPSNRGFDKGYSSADQRHTFVLSMVFQPVLTFENKLLRRVFNNNQFGIIASANSGTRFSILSEFDLNNDGDMSDRPVGFKRNSEKTPALYNVDLRYSRFLNFNERYKLELFGELQNLFNTNSIIGFNNTTVTTNVMTGELIGPLPDFRALNQSTAQESRQFQLGMKFIF
jgi:hypothetical protein